MIDSLDTIIEVLSSDEERRLELEKPSFLLPLSKKKILEKTLKRIWKFRGIKLGWVVLGLEKII